MRQVADSKRKAKSVDKSAAGNITGISATENQHFEELLKVTLK